jgi:hypothetical protein
LTAEEDDSALGDGDREVADLGIILQYLGELDRREFSVR